MPYIGTSPSNGVRRVHTYTATASQTTFTGASSEGITLSYADTNYIDVFQNGVLLGSADYTSTSGTSVVLAQGASADDLIVIVVYDVFSVADTVSKSSGGTFDSAVTMSSTLGVTGATTLSSTLGVTGASTLTGALSAKGGAVFNEDSADVDFRVEGDGNTHALFVQGSTDKVAIGNSNPNDYGSLASDLVIGTTSGEHGLTIATGTANSARMQFADNTSSPFRGAVEYSHGSDAMSFYTNGSNRMTILSTGGLDMQGVYDITTVNGANINVATDGLIRRSTSSLRYKNTVTDATHGLAELLTLRSVTYKGNNEGDTIFGGLIAEEVHNAGLTEFVQYNDDNEPDALAYGNMVSLCIKAIQELSTKVTALEAEVKALKGE